MEEPNFSSASTAVGDPLICHTRGVQEFGPAVFARGAYLAGHLAESKEPGDFWGKGWLTTCYYGFAACSRAACGSAGSTVEAADGVGCKERRWISARY